MLGLFCKKKEGAPLLTHPLRTNTETSPASVVGTPPAALAKTEETTNPDPVIITQKVPVRRTVVIRDTTIVSDTVYQVIGEP